MATIYYHRSNSAAAHYRGINLIELINSSYMARVIFMHLGVKLCISDLFDMSLKKSANPADEVLLKVNIIKY